MNPSMVTDCTPTAQVPSESELEPTAAFYAAMDAAVARLGEAAFFDALKAALGRERDRLSREIELLNRTMASAPDRAAILATLESVSARAVLSIEIDQHTHLDLELTLQLVERAAELAGFDLAGAR